MNNGTKFITRTLSAFAKEHGIIRTIILSYHSQANPIERVNRVLQTMIILIFLVIILTLTVIINLSRS